MKHEVLLVSDVNAQQIFRWRFRKKRNRFCPVVGLRPRCEAGSTSTKSSTIKSEQSGQTDRELQLNGQVQNGDAGALRRDPLAGAGRLLLQPGGVREGPQLAGVQFNRHFELRALNWGKVLGHIKH